MKVFIADDEVNVRQGLKNIINWNQLGFEICGEAGNGLACLEGILSEKPDLVLLDIQMPKMQGIQVAKNAREQGYTGKFIILSGYSDFEYAKSAIPYGIDFYLLKPIDEDELSSAVSNVYKAVMKERQEKGLVEQYFIKAKGSILKDVLLGKLKRDEFDENQQTELNQLGLNVSSYQIILVDNVSQDVHHHSSHIDIQNIFHLPNHELKEIDQIIIDDTNVLFIKGDSLIHRVAKTIHSIQKEETTLKGKVFMVAGKMVPSLTEIHDSYKQCMTIMEQKFFAGKGQYIIQESEFKSDKEIIYDITEEESGRYHDLLYKCIESYNRSGIKDTLEKMQYSIVHSHNDIDSIKNFITGIFLHIKHDVNHDYKKCDIQFESNTVIIATIQKMNFLYEVIDYIEEQMVQIIKAIGNSTCESILSDILHYIDLNFRKNLKLETIAAVFGYNSAYLGKVFTKNMGENFNSYVDKVRINYAKELVLEDRLKVYEIAEDVGYKNLDYFHRKFKKYVGYSPAEYRKMIKDNEELDK